MAWMKNMLAAAAFSAAVALGGAAAADDALVLKDGTRIEGEIIREMSGNVWIVVSTGGIETERFIPAGRIAEVIRDAAGAAEADAGGDEAPQLRRRADREEKVATNPAAPRGAVITLEGMVGVGMTSKQLEEMIPLLEEEVGDDGTGVVVLKINSGGGFLLEIQKISDVIENEYKPRFRTVAWIESAISAAAMSAHCLEEIYFMPEGNYGACTGWSGDLVAVKGRGLEEVYYMMERISDRGGYDQKIMRAMQGDPGGDTPLYVRRDPRTGEVIWSDEFVEGSKTINPPGEVLTLNSVQAEEWGFSDGTARTLEELTDLMGYEEVVWVGKEVTGLAHPVGNAEARNRRWRESITLDNQKLGEAFSLYQVNLQAAQGTQGRARGALIGRARRELRQIQRLYEASPNAVIVVLGLDPEQFPLWLEEQEELLRELARQP